MLPPPRVVLPQVRPGWDVPGHEFDLPTRALEGIFK